MFHFLGSLLCLAMPFLIIGGIVFWAKQQKLARQEAKVQKKYEVIQNAVKSYTQEHLKTLVRRKRILVIPDRYGVVNTSKWDGELDYFWRSVISGKIISALKIYESNEITGVAKLISIGTPSPPLSDEYVKLVAIAEVDRLVVEASKQTINQGVGEAPTDCREYEGYCRSILEQAGWKAWQPPGSGDQGGDVVAEKKNVVVVLQCKLWNRQIDNSAVQEVVAAKVIYSATVAIVVSNQIYTDSAHQLAAANNVLLLHHDDLASLDSFLKL
jgi:restriction system protein